MLWKLGDHQGEPVLYPVKDTAKVIEQCIELAEPVPGAEVDESGGVSGSRHALLACLKLAGEVDQWAERALRVKVPTGPLPNESLPKFQQKGSAFVSAHLEEGCVLNDGVGLGKTVQSIAAVSHDRDAMKLVLCPAFLRSQWKGEVEKWAPKFTDRIVAPDTHVILPKSKRPKSYAVPKNVEWLIAFYLDAEEAVNIIAEQDRPYHLIVDEIHNIKDYSSQRAEAIGIATLTAAGRVGLTASILDNHIGGLFQVCDLIQSHAWGWYGSFVKRYSSAKENEWGGYKLGKASHVEELRMRLGTMSIRRVKEEVWDQLPFETKFQTVWLDPPPGGARSIVAALRGHKGEHFRHVSEFKTPFVVEQIKSDLSAGVPSLTFTYTREQAKLITAQLPTSLLILGAGEGGTTASARLEKIAAYVRRCAIKKIAPAVVATYGALGIGANLQWAKVTNLASLNYGPEEVDQAIGRMARMGNEGQLIVRIFGCRQTIDEHFVRVIKTKLTEQVRVFGKEEKGKMDLYRALEPRSIDEALQRMLERYKEKA